MLLYILSVAVLIPVVDNEPIARKDVKKLVEEIPAFELLGSLNSAKAAAVFMNENPVDLVFLDIQMPGVSGLEFAKNIPKTTLVKFWRYVNAVTHHPVQNSPKNHLSRPPRRCSTGTFCKHSGDMMISSRNAFIRGLRNSDNFSASLSPERMALTIASPV